MGLSAVIRAQVTLQIVDESTHEPLVYVNVMVDTVRKFPILHTNNQGEVILPKHTQHIILSYYGYRDKVVVLDKQTPHNIEMSTSTKALDEVVLKSKENPAWALLRRVRNRADSLNPYTRFNNFSYTEYNKVSTKIDSIVDIDSLEIPFGASRLLSNPTEANVLQSEYVMKGYYQRYEKTKFELIASKFSGFKNKNILTLSNNVAPFHFFDEYVFLISRQYLNPIVDKGYDEYLYTYLDTTRIHNRLTYHIRFEPVSKVNPQRLIGEFYIDAQDFALARIIAKPSVPQGMNVAIDQLYEKQGKYWFPKDLQYKWFMMRYKGVDLINYGRSIFSDYRFNLPEIDTINFSAKGLIFSPKATQKSKLFWDKNRKIELSLVEKNTYKKYDSLNLDYLAEMVEKLGIKQHIQTGFVDLDIRHLMVNDQTYGKRYGMGIYTNQLLTDKVYVGGYLTYTKYSDRKLDWGASIQLNVDEDTKSKLVLSYTEDYLKNNPKNYYEFLSYDLNYTTEMRLGYEFISGYYDYNVYAAYQEVQFFEPKLNTLYSGKPFAEVGIDINFDYYKQYLPSYVDKYSVRRRKRINVQRWIPNIDVKLRFGQQLDTDIKPYGQLILGVQNKFISKSIQEMEVRLELATTLGANPIEKLFTGQSIYGGGSIWYLRNMFQTVEPSEFIHDTYAALFLRYNIYNLRLPWKYSSPRFHLIHNVGIGSRANNPLIQTGYMDKPLLEGGLLIRDLVQYPILGIGALGGGMGVFARYGALADKRQNLTFKLNWSFTF